MNYRVRNHHLDEYGIINPFHNLSYTDGETKRMGKAIKAHDVVRIEEGKHEGVIQYVIDREKGDSQQYDYTDIVIRMDDKNGTELKAGFPTSISADTALGKLLQNFGEKITVDKEYDVEKILKGKRCSFISVNEKTDKGTFARILKESIKPL